LVAAVLMIVVANSSGCRGVAERDTDVARTAKLKYGFRYDPMKWVENNKSVQAAQIRVLYLRAPRPGDKDTLEKEIDKILTKQQEDGSWAPEDSHGKPLGTTVDRVRQLLELGCPAGRPEVKKAVDFACRTSLKEKGSLGHGSLAVACLTGWREGNEPVRSLRQHAERCKTEPARGGCPWTIGGAFALWAGRQLADVGDVLAAELAWIPERMNSAGFNSYKDPWAYVGLAGELDHPLARQIVIKQMPLILRSQRADGGWGTWERRSYKAFRALIRHGLLEPLRKLPPLPSDWEIVRSIPAPGTQLWSMTWDGSRLWVLSKGTNEAIAVSPNDGEILERVKLPSKDPASIGWWKGRLVVDQWDPRSEIILVDPETAEVEQRLPLKKWLEEPGGVTALNGKLWVADGWNWVVIRVDPDKPGKVEHVVMSCPTGGGGSDVAAAGDGIWHYDSFWAALVKTPASAPAVGWTPEAARTYQTPEPLDWGEKPFPGLAGVAWDGERLWALDRRNRRICLLRKSDPEKPCYRWLDNATQIEISPIHAPRGSFLALTAAMRLANMSVADARVSLKVRPTATYTVAPERLDVVLPSSSMKSLSLRLTPTGKEAEKRPDLVVDWQATYQLPGGGSHTCEGLLTTHPLLPQITIPRLGELSGLDAVRDALKDRTAEIVRAGDRTVGELRLGVAAGCLAVHLRSHDPRCRADTKKWSRPADEKKWKGCNVDLYVSKPGGRTVRQFVFFAAGVKDRGRVEVYQLGRKQATPKFQWRIVPFNPFGYEVHALIPLSELLLEPKAQRFLFDMAVVVPPRQGEKAQFTLLYTGDPNRCAFKNNRYYAQGVVKQK